jgi:hypothetical protein
MTRHVLIRVRLTRLACGVRKCAGELRVSCVEGGRLDACHPVMAIRVDGNAACFTRAGIAILQAKRCTEPKDEAKHNCENFTRKLFQQGSRCCRSTSEESASASCMRSMRSMRSMRFAVFLYSDALEVRSRVASSALCGESLPAHLRCALLAPLRKPFSRPAWLSLLG